MRRKGPEGVLLVFLVLLRVLGRQTGIISAAWRVVLATMYGTDGMMYGLDRTMYGEVSTKYGLDKTNPGACG